LFFFILCFFYFYSLFLPVSVTGSWTWNTLSSYMHLREMSKPLRSTKEIIQIIWTTYWEELEKYQSPHLPQRRQVYLGSFVVISAHYEFWDRIMFPWNIKNFVLILIRNVWNIWTIIFRNIALKHMNYHFQKHNFSKVILDSEFTVSCLVLSEWLIVL